MSAWMRLKQGVADVFAFARRVDVALAERYLNEAQRALFQRMSRAEQLHSIAVLRTVLAQAPDTPHDLAVAALLHDAGKTRYRLSVWQRSAAVVVAKLAPRLEERLSAEASLSLWRAPFVVRRHHPEWSAALLRSTGASERALWLVAHHADDLSRWAQHPDWALLARLKQADDAN